MKTSIHWKRIMSYLGMFLFMCSFIAKGQVSYSIYQDNGSDIDPRGYVEVVRTDNTDANPSAKTFISVYVLKGFSIKDLTWNGYSQNIGTQTTETEKYIVYNYIIYTDTYDRDYKNKIFRAKFDLSPVTEPIALANILNYYEPGSTVLDGKEIVVSKSVSGYGKLLFPSGGTQMTIRMKESYISGFDVEITGGDVTVISEGKKTGLGGLNLLSSGSLTLEGECLDDFRMEGGSLIFKVGNEYHWNSCIKSLTVTGGDIIYKGEGYSFIGKLVINGDVTIIGENQYGADPKVDYYPIMAFNTVINKGNVKMKKVGLHRSSTLVVNGGNVELENITIVRQTYGYSNEPRNLSLIQQNGGTVLIKDAFLNNNDDWFDYFVEVYAGALTIDGGHWRTFDESCVHVANSSAVVDIKGEPYGCSILQETGKVSISGGTSNRVKLLDGELNITGGEFSGLEIHGGNLDISNGFFNLGHEIASGILILGEAKLILSGGYYYAPIYMDPSITLTPESVLAEGAGFYTLEESIQPDLPEIMRMRVDGSYKLLESWRGGFQIKSKSSPSIISNVIAAAQSADIGLDGKDLKIVRIGNAQYDETGLYNCEIKTPKGLCWLAAWAYFSQCERLGMNFNGSEYYSRFGAPEINEIRLIADLDMSSFDWIPLGCPYTLFDGQGHRISGLKVNQSGAAFAAGIGRSRTIANLIVSGMFNSIPTIYEIGTQSAAGLALYNSGSIINCAVEQSVISCETTDCRFGWVGGFVAGNYYKAVIENCYMTGNISCQVNPAPRRVFGYSVKGYKIEVGGLVGSSKDEGFIRNSYHADGTVDCVLASGVSPDLGIKKGDIVGDDEGGVIENCTTSPSLKSLNMNVVAHNDTCTSYASLWNEWEIQSGKNHGFPVHKKKGPSILHYPITYDLTNLDVDTVSQVPALSSVNIQLKKIAGYTFPDTVSVKMGTIELAADKNYIYNKDDGTIKIHQVTDSIRITALGKPLAIEIVGEESYIPAHRDNVVTVKSGAIYTIDEADAELLMLGVEEGAQLRLKKPLKVSNIAHLRSVRNKWTTFSMPVDMAMPDVSESIIQDHLCLKSGYLGMDDQRWIDADNRSTVGKKPYLLATNKNEAQDAYFLGHFMSNTAPVIQLEAVSSLLAPSNVENGNWFHFVANPYWENLPIQGRAYILNEAGTSFELQENPIISPFHCYMIASDEVMNKISSLRLGGIPTSVEGVKEAGFRAWTENRTLCFETSEAGDIVIYSLAGVPQARFDHSVGVKHISLPQGVYLIVCDGTAIKVVL